MKTLLSKTKQSVILLILASIFYACGGGGKYLFYWGDLKGTHWKLVQITHNGEHIMNFEPQDCDTCFTLFFETTSVGYVYRMSGKSILNTVDVIIDTNIWEEYLNKTIVSVTDYDEPYDGNLFSSLMRQTTMVSPAPRTLFFSSGLNSQSYLVFTLIDN